MKHDSQTRLPLAVHEIGNRFYLLHGPKPKSDTTLPADRHCGFTSSSGMFSSLLASDLIWHETGLLRKCFQWTGILSVFAWAFKKTYKSTTKSKFRSLCPERLHQDLITKGVTSANPSRLQILILAHGFIKITWKRGTGRSRRLFYLADRLTTVLVYHFQLIALVVLMASVD